MVRTPKLNMAGPVPLYVQLTDFVAAEIAAGRLRPGDKLPAERDLAEQWEVAYMTIRRTMKELRQRDLIVTTMGRGTFIAEIKKRSG